MANKNYSKKSQGKNVPNTDAKEQRASRNSGRSPKYERKANDKVGEMHARYAIENDKSCNDPAYYNKYPNDYKNSMDYPWFKIISRPLSIMAETGDPEIGPLQISLPQIMRIGYAPTIGRATQSTDPVNKCFNIVMADLYAKTTGASLGFQAADLAMEQVSLASLIGAVGQLKRALEVTDFWITKNQIYPKALLSSMGYSWEDLTTNKAVYVTKLNALIHQLNSMQLPKFLDVPQLYYTRSHSVYTDEDSEYGQIYYFWQEGFYKYEDTNMKAVFTKFSDKPITPWTGSLWRTHLQQVQDAVDAWYNSSDFYTINGALLRAYKSSALITLDDATTDNIINPGTDKSMLMQIMNMDIGVDLTSLDITQAPSKNAILCSPHSEFHGGTRVIRWFDSDENITIDDKCEMTRLCVATDANGVVLSCGVDLISTIELFALDPNNYTKAKSFGFVKQEVRVQDDATTGSLWPAILCNNFRYQPRVSLYHDKVSTATLMGDVYNYTTISTNMIDNMNTVAMYSIWKPEGVDL